MAVAMSPYDLMMQAAANIEARPDLYNFGQARVPTHPNEQRCMLAEICYIANVGRQTSDHVASIVLGANGMWDFFARIWREMPLTVRGKDLNSSALTNAALVPNAMRAYAEKYLKGAVADMVAELPPEPKPTVMFPAIPASVTAIFAPKPYYVFRHSD